MSLDFPVIGRIIIAITFALIMFAPTWLLPWLVFVLPFQAATVLNIRLGDYALGIQPGYFVGVIFTLDRLVAMLRSSELKILRPAKWVYGPLFAFFSYLLFTTLVIPRILGGRVFVFPPRGGITADALQPLAPSMTNVSQMFYLAISVLVAFLVTHEVFRNSVSASRVRAAFVTAGILVAVLGLYQIAAWYLKLPFPYDLLYTNPSYALIGRFQTVGNIRRLSSTFAEASYAAYYLVGVFGYLGGEYLVQKGYPRATLALLLLAVLLTFSTSGILALGVLAVWGAWVSRERRALLLKWVLVAGGALIGIAAIGVILWGTGMEAKLHVALSASLWGKTATTSFVQRAGADMASLKMLWTTWGFGAGWGSNRASSLLINVLSNGGLWGSFLLLGFLARIWKLVRPLLAQDPIVLGLTTALIGTLVCGLAGVPDLSFLFVWLNLGWIVGYALRRNLKAYGDGPSTYP